MTRPTPAKIRSRPRPAGRTPRDRIRSRTWLVLLLGAMLALPVSAALHQLTPRAALIGAGVILLCSALAFVAYRADKHRAQTGGWRIPESTLHAWALLGGWPGAWVAQRSLRHKNAKASFQFVFWLIVLLHQAVALDALLDWRGLHALLAAVGRVMS